MAFISSPATTLIRSPTPFSFVSHHCRLPHTTARPRRATIQMQGPVRSKVADTPRKVFLEKLKALGKVRLVVRNPVGILETVANFDSLFYATVPTGEYANLVDHKLNLDMHLLLTGFTGVKFEQGVSRSKSKAPLYSLRLLGQDKETHALSVFVMWDKDPEDIEPHRIQAWKDLKTEYISADQDDTFFFDD